MHRAPAWPSLARMLALVLAPMLAACGDDVPGIDTSCRAPMSIAIFTRETLYFHASTPIAAATLGGRARARGWDVVVGADPAMFTDELLARTDAIVFSVTSGNILDADTRARLQIYFTSGGGFTGTHAASATEYDWPFYKTLVPASFRTHPAIQRAVLTVESDDPIVAGLPRPWFHSDELYTFYDRPEDAQVDVLLSLDEAQMSTTDYPGDFRVGYHPLAWKHEHHGGRAFYTALGHTTESYSDPLFLETLERGIAWSGEARHRARCGD
jgi:type 1 glutamine amidotransferase